MKNGVFAVNGRENEISEKVEMCIIPKNTTPRPPFNSKANDSVARIATAYKESMASVMTDSTHKKIVLTSLNARYSHANLGLRYLHANLGDWIDDAIILEFTIKSDRQKVIEQIKQYKPDIIGIGVYIWNIDQSTELVKALKQELPDAKIVLGGPEVSYEYEHQEIVKRADYLVTGWGDHTFAKLVHQLLIGPKPIMKVHVGEQPDLAHIQMPYHLYNDEDLRQRNIYVEASRGCPFKCEFCISSLDKTAWAFDTALFLVEMQKLYDRGARTFKFVDRTFNLKPETGRQILAFFKDKLNDQDPVFVHFEMVPDHLPDVLKNELAIFPSGTIQLEIGIQTLNARVGQLISRKTNLQKAKENIQWLRENTNAHMHVDLIAGLPGEDLNSFGVGLNELAQWGSHEIQLGILKRLKGTPIIRHDQEFEMKYDPSAPYRVLSTTDIPEEQMNDFALFAKYWDLIINSGRFKNTEKMILERQPYERFNSLTQHLKGKWNRSHSIPLESIFIEIKEWLLSYNTLQASSPAAVEQALLKDYIKSGAQGKLPWMEKGLTVVTKKQKHAQAQERQLRVVEE